MSKEGAAVNVALRTDDDLRRDRRLPSELALERNGLLKLFRWPIDLMTAKV